MCLLALRDSFSWLLSWPKCNRTCVTPKGSTEARLLIFLFFARKSCGNFEGSFASFFRPTNRAKTFREDFRGFFVSKIAKQEIFWCQTSFCRNATRTNGVDTFRSRFFSLVFQVSQGCRATLLKMEASHCYARETREVSQVKLPLIHY